MLASILLFLFFALLMCCPKKKGNSHYVKRVRIRGYSGPYFPAFGINTKKCFLSLRIQSECGKIRTRITLNTDTFYAVPSSTAKL